MKKSYFITSGVIVMSIIAQSISWADTNESSNTSAYWTRMHQIVADRGYVWIGSVADYLRTLEMPLQHPLTSENSPNKTSTGAISHIDQIVVSPWYRGILPRFLLSKDANTYAILGANFTDEDDEGNPINFSTEVFSNGVVTATGLIYDINFTNGHLPIRYVSLMNPGETPPYSDVIALGSGAINGSVYVAYGFSDIGLVIEDDDNWDDDGSLPGRITKIEDPDDEDGRKYIAKDGKRLTPNLYSYRYSSIDKGIVRNGHVWVLGDFVDNGGSIDNALYRDSVIITEGNDESTLENFVVDDTGENIAYMFFPTWSSKKTTSDIYVNGQLYKELDNANLIGIAGTEPVYYHDIDPTNQDTNIRTSEILRGNTRIAYFSYNSEFSDDDIDNDNRYYEFVCARHDYDRSHVFSDGSLALLCDDQVFFYSADGKKYRYPLTDTRVEDYLGILGNTLFFTETKYSKTYNENEEDSDHIRLRALPITEIMKYRVQE